MSMNRDRQLTDCLQVVRHGRKRNRLVKGKEEEKTTVRSKTNTVKRERNTEQETDDTPLPEPTPLEKLIQFDLDWRFGPCTGITRLQRWQRARDLGLMPPKNIREILSAHIADPQYQFNLWYTYAI
ncbi:DNA polymerase delta subunit 4 [Mixophyes fleayi]|uniref:DNA polymerase delta subunit 4 n=1 Tax=Mixophyes fleayi TaxID=3061075 RepID=UPI003F4E2DD2